MKKVLLFITIALLLTSFVFAQSMTSKAVKNDEKNYGAADNSQADDDSNIVAPEDIVCCKISGLSLPGEGVSYELVERSECSVPEGVMDVEKEIVDDEFCEAKTDERFCGTSTYGACETDADCLRAGCSNSVCQSVGEESTITTCEFKECYNTEKYNARCVCLENQCQWLVKKELKGELTQAQIGKIIRERNRLEVHAQIQAGECPENCTCTGSVIKCEVEGRREMRVMAGESGNVIVISKDVNASTNVALYHHNGRVFANFRNNETKEIILPDEAKARLRERIHANFSIEKMELSEEGKYEVQARKRARLFGIIPVRERVRAEINAETGEIIRTRVPWWSFLARDEVSEDFE